MSRAWTWDRPEGVRVAVFSSRAAAFECAAKYGSAGEVRSELDGWAVYEVKS